MKKLLFLLIALGCISASAQTVPTAVAGNAAWTNSLVVSSQFGTKVNWVSVYNGSGITEYVQIFQTNSVPISGTTAIPTFSYPITATSFLVYDFGMYGVDLDRVTICISTNSASLGLAAATNQIQCIYRVK